MSKRNAINRFFSVWEIMSFVAAVCIISVLLFPKKEILSIILKKQAYVSPEFIMDVIRVDNNENLKLALVRNYIKSGRYRMAKSVLNSLRFNLKRVNFLYYISLKYKLLNGEYYSAKSAGEKEIIKNKIKALLSILPMVSAAGFNRYLSGNGGERLKWILDGYKFESDTGNYKLALDLLQRYLAVYPEYNKKYYKKITVLYIITGDNRKAYDMLDEYMKTHNDYNEKAAFFDAAAEKAVLRKNRKLTMLLLKIYKENFPDDLKIEKLLLTYALQSGDPYFARYVAMELSKGSR